MTKRLKLVHTADVHLDWPFAEGGQTGYSRGRREDIKAAFSAVIRRALMEKADLLIIAGDLYEHHHASAQTIAWLSRELHKAGLPVFIVPGNHDPYVANAWYATWEWPENVHILHSGKPTVTLDRLSVQVHGIGFQAFRQEAPDLSLVPPPSQGFFNILVLHGTLDMTFGHHPYNPVTSTQLDALGYDYYALGHFHKEGTGYALKRAFNPGSPEPLGFDEKGEHGAFLVSMEKEGHERARMDIKSFSTAARLYAERSLDLTGTGSGEEIRMKLLGVLEGLNPDRDLVRILLKGYSEEQPNISELTSSLGDWRYLRLLDQTRRGYDLSSLSKEMTARGAFVRAMLERLNQEAVSTRATAGQSNPENSPFSEELVEKALLLGLEALETGKITSLRDRMQEL